MAIESLVQNLESVPRPREPKTYQKKESRLGKIVGKIKAKMYTPVPHAMPGYGAPVPRDAMGTPMNSYGPGYGQTFSAFTPVPTPPPIPQFRPLPQPEKKFSFGNFKSGILDTPEKTSLIERYDFSGHGNKGPHLSYDIYKEEKKVSYPRPLGSFRDSISLGGNSDFGFKHKKDDDDKNIGFITGLYGRKI